jgi:hypothetical protein
MVAGYWRETPTCLSRFLTSNEPVEVPVLYEADLLVPAVEGLHSCLPVVAVLMEFAVHSTTF